MKDLEECHHVNDLLTSFIKRGGKYMVSVMERGLSGLYHCSAGSRFLLPSLKKN